MTPIRTLRPLAKVVLSTQSDERLVALSRDGSEDAFAEIVRRHRPGLLRLARSLGSGDRADDVVQDGLVRAWRALQSSDADIDLRPWLATIVRNRALTAHSTNRIHEELDETIDGVRQPGDIVIMREELRSAVSAVNALPDSQREALVRSALAGESHDQIASALATSPGAVRQLIFRARTGLREAVGAVIPLPLVRALADIGAGGAAVGAGAAAATAGGAGLGIKALAVVIVGATVAGGGVAIQRDATGAQAKQAGATKTTTAEQSTTAQTEAAQATPAAADKPAAQSPQGDTTDEQLAAKDADASVSAVLKPAGSNDYGSPRLSETTAADQNVETANVDEQQNQPPPAHDQSGHHPQSGGQQPPPQQPQQQPGQTGYPSGGDHHPPQQPAPAPPPPGPQQSPTDGHHGGDGSYDHDGDGRQGQDFYSAP